MNPLDWVGHALLFFLSGCTYWLMRAGRNNIGSILTIALPVVGVYFLGWWALMTFFIGMFYAARLFSKAVQSGRNPFENPWKKPSEP